MDKVKTINAISEKPMELITSAMERELEIRLESKVKHLMLISIALANYAANKDCDNPKEAYLIKDVLDDHIIKALTESLEVE